MVNRLEINFPTVYYQKTVGNAVGNLTFSSSGIAYKARRLDPREQAVGIIQGFQGQLKYWWDNFLSEEEHTKILDYQRTWTDEDGMQHSEPAAPSILIHTITVHFIGNPREEQAAAKSVLINLRCPTLSDYRWYKDVFLTNVLKREDGLANFWKERFIAGLPKLFGERILSKLRQNFATNDIPFNLLTFGNYLELSNQKVLIYAMS